MEYENRSTLGDHEYRSALILSSAFVIVFTGYFAIQNLQSSLNQEEGLGIISLSCLYACIIVSGALAPAVINVIGEKWSLIAAFISHVIYTSTNFYPSFVTLVPASLLVGLTAGPLWTAQCVYLADRAMSYAKRKGMDEHSTLSRFNGIFFGMYETTQITGNVISSLVLRQGVDKDGVLNTTSASEDEQNCGRYDCPLNVNATRLQEPDRHVVYILLGVFLAFDLIGVALTVFFLPPLRNARDGKKGELLKSMISCGKKMMDPNLAMLIPLIMFMAMEQAILWTDYTKSYISCPIGIQQIGFVMAGYGTSSTVFALLHSRLVHFTGRYVMFGIAGTVNMAIFVVLYFWTPTKDSVLIYCIPVVWGVAEGIWETQSNALFAVLFPDKTDSAFANYHTWKATGFSITFVYSNFLCVSTKLIIAMALLGVSMILYIIVEVKTRRQAQETEN